MDKRVYMLTVMAFIVGMAELIIGGILDVIANDLDITVSEAGHLITIFALTFAIAPPILLVLFAKVERTQLTFIALIIFLIGISIAIFSSSFSLLMLSRIISAASGSLIVVLCINLASNIVEPAFRGRAIGLVVMGTSGSLVLGLPIGVLLGNIFHWRAPFILIAVLSLFLLFGVKLLMGKVEPRPVLPLKTQIATLKNNKILFAHFTTFFFLAGHFTFYAFLTPYAKNIIGFSATTISILYFIYGIAAVSGGGLSGAFADKFGVRRTLLSAILLLAVSLFLLPYSINFLPVFWLIVVVWGILSWAITPPIQSHLYEIANETADVQQSLNNSALHLGIAFGTFCGSLVVQYSSIENNAHVGIIFVILAFMTASVTLHTKHKKLKQQLMNE